MSTSEETHLIATLYPAPGKTKRLLELFEAVLKGVFEDEPGVLRYQLHQEVNSASGTDELIMLETYKDKQALEEHRKTPHYKALGAAAAQESLMVKPPHIKFIRPVGGFASRL